MGTQFQSQRSDDAIIISPEICTGLQEFEEPISKRQKIPEESSSNPSYPYNSNSLKRQNCLFFKTRLCVKFGSGSCTNGPNCTFAHGSKELRRPPPNWQGLVAKDGSVSEEQMLLKNRICKMFYRGEVCSYGERCTFMHAEPGMFAENANVSKGSASVSESGNGSECIVIVGSGNGRNQKQIFWKTKICNKWEAVGHCPFGEKCHFAHGNAELMEFRSHMELDRMNVAAAPLRRYLQPTKGVSPSTIMSSVKHQSRGFIKWEGLQRISHIYADWIGDVPFRICNSPSKVGT